MIKTNILTTGIGSLPFTDAEQALDLIFEYFPRIPFWPQLPKRRAQEGMIAQFSENLPGLKFSLDKMNFCVQDKDKELELFYERIINNDTDYFGISEDFSAGFHGFYRRLERTDLNKIEFIKAQITGPFTFAGGINDAEGKALLYDKIMLQAVIKGLSMKALWQIDKLKKFGKKIIMFIDEPYLSCFGSAYTPLNREEVVSGLKELTSAIKSENVLTGLHCCGNTDWSMFTDTPAIDIISFDAFDFLDRLILYAEDLKSFLARKGVLCWGIAPTQNTEEVNNVLLIEKIKEGMDNFVKKGLDKKILTRQLLLSPSCGLGALTFTEARKVFNLLRETALQFSLTSETSCDKKIT